MHPAYINARIGSEQEIQSFFFLGFQDLLCRILGLERLKDLFHLLVFLIFLILDV